jgi:hypothetical protein
VNDRVWQICDLAGPHLFPSALGYIADVGADAASLGRHRRLLNVPQLSQLAKGGDLAVLDR